jgi:hypothetical protein
VHAALTALLMAVPLGTAISQSSAPATPSVEVPQTLVVRADNDAFDFWMKPWNRPDEEYTSGVHITYEGGDAPRWARSRLADREVCVAGAARCRQGALEIGQDMYTPPLNHAHPHPGPGARPNAGWLYVSQRAAALDEQRARELTLTLGVTGPPSLASVTQQLVHSIAPKYNRPIDWSRQIGFEPGLIVRYDERRRFALTDPGRVTADLVPRVSASAGNVLTDLEAGFRLRAGWNLAHPWLPESHGVDLAFVTGASGRAIARTIFLDGNTFGSSPRVGHRPFVGAAEWGVQAHFRALAVEYRVVTESRSFANGPKWHPWASMVAGLTFSR